MKGRVEGVESKLAAAHCHDVGQGKGGSEGRAVVVGEGEGEKPRRTRSRTRRAIGSRRRRAASPNGRRMPRKIRSTRGLSKGHASSDRWRLAPGAFHI